MRRGLLVFLRQQHLRAGIPDGGSASEFIHFQEFDGPFPLTDGQDTGKFPGWFGRRGGQIHLEQHARFTKGRDANQLDPGQWHDWQHGRLGLGRLQVEDVAAGDSEIGMPRSIGNEGFCAQGQH